MSLFDEMASRYDTGERAQVADIIAAQIRKRVHGCGQKAALDYGCGTGLVGLQLADCFESLLLVDSAPQMLAQVRQKIEDRHLANASTLCADFLADVPLGLSADIILMAQVLLHIPDTGAILRKMHGLLNPGGRLLIVDFNKKESITHPKVHNGFHQVELMGRMAEVGFVNMRAETFYHGRNLFMNQDASLFLLDAEK